MWILGGYYMSYDSARKLATHLGIDVGEDTAFDRRHMEWPFNNWLYNTGRLHIKSATIPWPVPDGEDGLMFISKFRPEETVNSPADMAEDEKDLEVKRWLEESGVSEMVWATLWDQFRITLNGIQPKFYDTKFEQVSLEVAMADIEARLREVEAIKAAQAAQPM
jgi:hypothetical protein